MNTDKENAERALRLVRQAARILEGVPNDAEADKKRAAAELVEKMLDASGLDAKTKARVAGDVQQLLDALPRGEAAETAERLGYGGPPVVVGNAGPTPDVAMFPSMPLVHSPPTLTCAPLITGSTTVVLNVIVRGRMIAPKEVVIENVTGMSARMEHDPSRYGVIGCFAPGTGGSVEFTTDVAHYGPFQVPDEHVAATLLALAALYQNLPRRQ